MTTELLTLRAIRLRGMASSDPIAGRFTLDQQAYRRTVWFELDEDYLATLGKQR